MIVEQSIRSADHGLTIAPGIPGQADARLYVVLVGLNSFLQSQQVISAERQPRGSFKLRRNLHVITQAVIQCEIAANVPRVLPEKSDRNVVKRIAGAAQALNEISGKSGAVGLHRGKIREVG